MNTKKFMEMFTTAIIPIGLMIWGGNFAYAEEETHKHSLKLIKKFETTDSLDCTDKKHT